MRLSVCIKQVPDVSAPNRLEDGQIVQDTERLVLNAYDASALEAALVLREEHGGEIDVVCVGPEKAAETIRKALAMGADRATHLVSEADDGLDSRAVADLLAAHFRSDDPEVILCGKQSQDTDAGLAGAILAERLGLPYVSNAVGIELEERDLVVTRQSDDGREVIKLTPPCLVTCSNDMNDPRIPSLKGIMASKRKEVKQVSVDSLGIDDRLADDERLATQILSHSTPPERGDVKFVDGEPEEAAAALADLLRNEAKVL